MSGFAADWLQRREPFDEAARARNLARGFDAALEGSAPRRIIDLAAGSGANFRALAPLLAGDQEWLLLDSDPLLIAAQTAEIARWSQAKGWRCSNSAGGVLVETGDARWQVHAQKIDLAQDLEQVDLAACDGVVTAAFLDLVSTAWLDRLCDWLKRFDKPLLAVLTVDGRREWQPALSADARIQAAFQRHQHGDKGFGSAAGKLATSDLAARLMALGYAVSTARSDWRIDSTHREMLLQMVTESAAVACEAEPAAAALFTDWSAQRNEQIGAAVLALAVGHLDLLAVTTRQTSGSQSAK